MTNNSHVPNLVKNGVSLQDVEQCKKSGNET